MVGATYKPGVADIRESPALAIIDLLAVEGAHVAYTDPQVDVIQTPAAGRLSHLSHPAEEQWDLVVVHTIHPGHDYGWLSSQPAVLDTTYRLAESVGRHVL
jgi:UDP-N-acetyl-D-mannosaminuronate dehydrogenase